MADFNNLALTFRGVKALLEAQAGTELILSKIGLGSGTFTGSTVELTSMAVPEVMIPISEKKVQSEGYLTLIAKMTNEDVTEGFYWRETGLFFEDSEGNDVLFAYACVSADDKYDYVPAYSDQRYIKHVRIANIITDSADITVKEGDGLLYVDILTYQEFLEEYGEHKASFENHIKNTNNPHDVTKTQVGLGSVPNVSTNNQTPTYTVENTLETLTSGEILSKAFGKIAKAISDLISHIGNKSNPHSVTASLIGALTSSNIVNNLATTASGYALDARQGKALYDKMTSIKHASITASGSNAALGLSVDTPTKVPLNTKPLNTVGCRPSGANYSFELTSDGGIKCPLTGTVLVSGSAFITGDSTDSIVNKGCTVRRKTSNGSGEYGEETDVCAQFIRDVGVGGGISAGTKAISVQDADILYLYARSSETAKCDTTNAATYLSLTYLSVG